MYEIQVPKRDCETREVSVVWCGVEWSGVVWGSGE